MDRTGWLLSILSIGLMGCSTSPPNLSQGLLTRQDVNRVYAFGSLDIFANLGKSEFVGDKKVYKHASDSGD